MFERIESVHADHCEHSEAIHSRTAGDAAPTDRETLLF